MIRRLAMGALLLLSGLAGAAEFEKATTLKAADILPKDLLAGPNHNVEASVANDGYLNLYMISTPVGQVQAVSTATLRKYVQEINAAARMREVKASKEFTAGMKEKADQVVEGTKALITDPVDTISGTVSGVGKLFGRARENLTGDARSDVETSRTKDLIGFSKTKRDYAYSFGVDVYSRNPILQEALDDISWAGFTGNLTASAALMAVPGGAGAAVSVAGGSQLMNNVFRDAAPADLRIMNRQKLDAMAVSKDIADLFISNSVYTPREQTLLVDAIAGMDQVAGREEFIKFAVLAGDPDVAFFRQRQAQMYAALHKTAEPLKSFVPVGQISAARTASGKLIIAAPLDHMLWTNRMAQFATLVTQDARLAEGVKERHLWVTGTLSAMARTGMQKLGWKVHEKSESLLAAAP